MSTIPAGQMNDGGAQMLLRIVERDRARWKRLLLLQTLALLIAAPLAYLLLIFFIDNLFHLPRWARLISIALFVVCAAYLAVRLGRSWRRATRQLTADQVALAIERRTDPAHGVQNRLINALQLWRDGGDESHLAVIRENFAALQNVKLENAAHTRPAMLSVAAAAVIVLLGIGFFTAARDQFTNAASRLFMPLADIAPIYRTTLEVEPGDIRVERGSNVTIRVRIDGQVPSRLTLLRQAVKAGNGSDAAARSSVMIPVQDDQREVVYRLENVAQTTLYTVRGGDYTTRAFRIEVLEPAELSSLTGTVHLPDYVQRPPQPLNSAAGDIEALVGSKVELRFALSAPAESAAMLVERPAAPGQSVSVEEIALTHGDADATYTGTLVMDNVIGYRLRTTRADTPTYQSRLYALRALPDLPPKLAMSGLELQSEVAIDTVLPVSVEGSDDYGLKSVGIFYRVLPPTGSADDVAWKPIQTWDVADRATTFSAQHTIMPVTLELAEGDRVQVAVRGTDIDPKKADQWSTGSIYSLRIGGEGAAMQVLYERILANEKALAALIQAQQTSMAQAQAWLDKMSPASGLRWDDPANLEALAAAMKEQAAGQQRVRDTAGQVARDLVEQAGNLRLSLGMLADTEMVRGVNILNAVPSREHPQAMRAALGDAKLTQERTIRSLQEIHDAFVAFRKDWELANMLPFTRMLAERQGKMSVESAGHAGSPQQDAELGAALVRSMTRRQEKVRELLGLVQTALGGIGQRADTVGPKLAAAFTAASASLAAEPVQQPLAQALEHLGSGRWEQAAAAQQQAALAVMNVYNTLKQVQADVARELMAVLQQESDLQGQQDIAELREGDKEHYFDLEEETLELVDIIHMRKVDEAKKKNDELAETKVNDYLLGDNVNLQTNDPKTQQFELLKLGKTPTGSISFPHQSDRQANRVKPLVQEKFEDLVGELLEEADELKEKYDTYNLNYAGGINEPGEIGKQGGDINSTAAAAATGNMKPPPNDFGGASRVGRQGARAHGQAVGSESINRRGRDEVQEAQEHIGQQAGTMREIKSDDMQPDSSVGTGGKKVETDDPTSFNVKDSGQFNEDILNRMDAPKEKHLIVERMGDPLDPKVAEMLRDLESDQEQLIERIKAIRKELRNLYLPTDNLDQLMAELTANLDRLKEKPDAQAFRAQIEALDRLRGAALVFSQAGSDFQPSVRREQAVRGRVVDEAPGHPLPGYEDAVKRYYEKLAGQ